jgi:dihydroorotase-like cyclic amidohydrolase
MAAPSLPVAGTVPVMATLLLRNLVFGDTSGGESGDLLIRDGSIIERGSGLTFAPEEGEEFEEFDAAGLTALPGAIDALAPIGAPRGAGTPADDLGSGTIAAARGGVTTVAVPLVPGARETCDVAFHDAERRASGAVFVDYVFLVGLGQPLADTPERMRGVGFHVGFGGSYLDLDVTYQAGTAGPGAHLRVAALSETPITVRMAGRLTGAGECARLEALTGLAALSDIAPHVLPLASAEAVEALPATIATGSTSIVHLCLDELPYSMRTAPALGSAEDRDALWAALADGRLEGVVSDHRSEPLEGDSDWVGVASLELFLPALLSAGVAAGRIDLPTLCEIIGERPARRLGMWPRKGSLQVGADGDVALVDPTAVWTVDPTQLEGRGKAPAWHDLELTGRVVHVFSRGQQIVNDGFPLFRPGRGRPV